ncbi:MULTISPECIES: hypothetical protein [Fischerella]|jgi:ribosomal protein L37AE/L43A|uniref:hypothetical protein n=1 Tax=Fischerella TaxID=1190 RepID=UPI000721CF56|nr:MULTISPECIES: hypothetical protein [Fischerella]BAU07139.1 hypothetical protein FIS3754_30650 [Fischerella sp. NIES-3754]BCX09462.1 MAG: hypothetical protein KatS3mg066_3321 [Fischerella sp.]
MNMRSNTCPCCGDSLLRHVRHGELYWFCQTCRQEVPLLSTNINRLSSVVEKRVVAKD